MKYKTPTPTRTLTRARLDAAVYALYLKLHDGKARPMAATKFIRQAGLGTELLEDLRQLGRLTSTGTGRGQKHAWTGAPPTAELVDQVEHLRELRAHAKAERLRQRQDKQQTKTETVAADPLATALPLCHDLTTDELLDVRSLVDKLLKLKNQPRLF